MLIFPGHYYLIHHGEDETWEETEELHPTKHHQNTSIQQLKRAGTLAPGNQGPCSGSLCFNCRLCDDGTPSIKFPLLRLPFSLFFTSLIVWFPASSIWKDIQMNFTCSGRFLKSLQRRKSLAWPGPIFLLIDLIVVSGLWKLNFIPEALKGPGRKKSEKRGFLYLALHKDAFVPGKFLRNMNSHCGCIFLWKSR